MQIASVYVRSIARPTGRGGGGEGSGRRFEKTARFSFFFFFSPSLPVPTRSRLHSSRLPGCGDGACDTPSDSAGKGQQDKHMASGIMGVGVTAVRVGFIFFVCTRSPPSDPNPPPLPPPPPPSPSSRFLQVAGKVTPGLVCQENNGGPICPAIARKAVSRLLPTLPPPPTLSTDICNGGGGGLISLGSERTLEKEPTGVNKRLRAVWLGAFSLPLRETDLHLKELFRFRRQNKLLSWLKTGRKKKNTPSVQTFPTHKAQSANLPPKCWSGGQKRFLRW